MNPENPRVRIRGLCKDYPGVRALDDVNLEVRAGIVHALVGENGAGKSTLIKILAGAVGADSGGIQIDGRTVEIPDARTAQSLGIAVVHQEFNLAPDLSVSENVFLGRWPHRPVTGLIRFDDLHDRAERLFADLELDIPVRVPLGRLGVAQWQMVEIAKALSLDARVLILDEPSAVLTPHELAALFRIVRRLTARGVSVIYISHRMEEVFDLADDVTVLRDGRHISTRPIGETNRGQLILECVGRPIDAEFPAREARIGDAVLQVERLSATGRFDGVTFDVRAGEVLALTGLVGSGRSSVGRAIFGALSCNGGVSVRSGNMTRTGPFRSPRAAMRAGIALIPEDRRREGLLLRRSIAENVTLAHREMAAVCGWISPRREGEIARGQIADLRIKASSVAAPAGTLSGGNQQKTLLGRWLVRRYLVMILDEPTRGVDVGAKVEIYGLINALAARGTAILMITSELPEATGMADRIGVMCEGRLTGILDNHDRQVSQVDILRRAVGERE